MRSGTSSAGREPRGAIHHPGVQGFDAEVAAARSRATAVAAGGYHTWALTSAGAVPCWGRNSSGQLGDGTTTTSPTPVAGSGLETTDPP